jgi:Protein of unknown function (DUF3775)
VAQSPRLLPPFKSLDGNILAAIIVLADLGERRRAAAEAARREARFGLTRLRDIAPDTRLAPDERALRATLLSLSQPALDELTALTFIGVDRDPRPLFALALRHARRTSDAGDVEYLMEKPLGEMLRAGLTLLGLKHPVPFDAATETAA